MAVGIPQATWAYDDPNPAGTVVPQLNDLNTLNQNNGTVTLNYGTVVNNNAEATVEYNRNGGTVTNNYGTVTENMSALGNRPAGTVTNNESGGVVHSNNGLVENNKSGATVWSNSRVGIVTTNSGTVDHNYGTIVTNDTNGFVNTNNGTITNNSGAVWNQFSDGTIEVNTQNGTVGSVWNGEQGYSSGTVKLNNGTVNNNASGVVIANQGGTVNGGTVQFDLEGGGRFTNLVNDAKVVWEIVSDFWEDLSGSAAAGTTYVVEDNNGDIEHFWLWDQGSLVLSAADRTKIISGVTLTSGNNVTITDNHNGTWTISGLGENIEIEVAFDDRGNPVPVAVRTVTEDTETGSNRATSDIALAAGTVVTAAQINAMIESALAANPNATVLDLDLGNDPSFTADTLIALCEKSSVAKRCHFTHNGIKSILFIPVIDPTSAAYQQCKALLDLEPGKQAGPIRLSQLFKPVGFDCLGE